MEGEGGSRIPTRNRSLAPVQATQSKGRKPPSAESGKPDVMVSAPETGRRMTRQDAASTRGVPGPILLTIAAVAAAGLAFLYSSNEFRAIGGLGFPLDDSWIHLQFARQVALGQGLAYRGADLVSGSTAPLWTALLSLSMLLPVPIVLTVKALGITLFALSAIAVWRLARALDLEPSLATLAMTLFLFTDWMVWSALSGMEILLAIWLSLEGSILHLRERRSQELPPRSLLLFALAALVRPELLLLVVLALIDRVLDLGRGEAGSRVSSRSRALLPGVVAACLPLVVVATVNVVIGGSPFPQTLAVKTEGINHILPPLRSLFRVVEILFRPQPFMALLAGGGALALFDRLGGERDRGLLPAMWLFGLPLAYATLSPPDGEMVVGNFGRYFFVLLPFMIVLGVVALESASLRLRELLDGSALARPVMLSIVLVLLLPSVAATLRGAQRYARNVFDVETSDVAAGHWLRQTLPETAVLAVQDVGAIAYLTENPLIDMAGITTPEILPYIKGDRRGSDASGLGGLFEYLREQRVDYMVLFPESYGGMKTLLELEPELRPVYEREIPGNITMAGSRLLVLATPWGGHTRVEP